MSYVLTSGPPSWYISSVAARCASKPQFSRESLCAVQPAFAQHLLSSGILRIFGTLQG